MFELEKDLYSCLAEIYNTTELNDRVYADELDLNYDFKENKVGIYYTINNINDNEYKDKVTIDVNPRYTNNICWNSRRSRRHSSS